MFRALYKAIFMLFKIPEVRVFIHVQNVKKVFLLCVIEVKYVKRNIISVLYVSGDRGGAVG